MAVIKSAHTTRMARDAVVLDMGDLGRQAQRILSDARAQADQLLLTAQTEAKRLREDAVSTGHAEGSERGLAEGREQGLTDGRAAAFAEWNDRLTQLTQRWDDALTGWEAQRTAMLHEAREDIIECVIALTRKVILRAINADQTIVRDQLDAALALLGKATAAQVVINPRDRAVIEECLKAAVDRAQNCVHAHILEDESMMPGGCVVRTASAAGGVDASIETQLERIAEALAPGSGPAIDAAP
jgi:flagellar biosynthesis/type III secretory pathway protein FliH